MIKRLYTFAAAAVFTLSVAPMAQAVPNSFTAVGEAETWTQGKAERPVPNTLYYQAGRIRLEMAAPVSAEGVTPFNVVLAKEGGKTITLLNPAEKQAMKLEISSLNDLAENRSLQRISQFQIKEFTTTFTAQSKVIGQETIAGEACTVREQRDKQGHVKVWLSNRYQLPFRFLYLENNKPAFAWTVKRFTPSSNLGPASFSVPTGYEVVDLSEMLNGMENTVKPAPAR
jgi:hypothetical protein